MKKKKILFTAIAIFGFATISMAQNVRAWGTYYTGTGQVWPNGEDRGQACITDAAGNVYMVGTTNSNSDIATVGAHQTICAGGDTIGGFSGTDAFLVKFNSSGVRQWATYYGGSEWDYGTSCAIDASGNVYMIGTTSSISGIATAGAHETSVNDGFLVKFNSSGVRQWGTYFEGNGNACTTDASGNIYIVGLTNSISGIATAGAHQTVMSGSGDAFLVKFNSTGVIQWGTYYDGLGDTQPNSCATDASGNVYMAGQVFQELLPDSGISTPGAHQTTYGGGFTDAFLVKFDPNGVRQWGTYYGGSGLEEGTSCAIDPSGNVYMAGHTGSTTGIATAGAHQTVFGGGGLDGFLVCFNSSGVRQSGTYYGEGFVSGCASDASGNVYMAGITQSSSGIATAGAHQTANGNSGYNDAFLVKFSGISVGINETINDKLFTIYPNPSQSIVNVQADAKLIGSAYSIHDNTGKVVLSGTINSENISVDLGNLAAGIYLFNVGENVKQTFKVIKE